jgi:hypothetical protein
MTDPMLPPGSNFCKCATCGNYFLNYKAFDAHRIGAAEDRGCLPTPEYPVSGLTLDSRGYWRFPKSDKPFPVEAFR